MTLKFLGSSAGTNIGQADVHLHLFQCPGNRPDGLAVVPEQEPGRLSRGLSAQ